MYSVPLIQPDVRREEAILQIVDALVYLETISTDIFQRYLPLATIVFKSNTGMVSDTMKNKTSDLHLVKQNICISRVKTAHT